VNPLTEDGFQALLDEANRRTSAREQEIQRLVNQAGKGGSVRFRRHLGTALAGPCPSTPGKHRITRFDAKGAIGHTIFNTSAEAIESALREGYTAERVEVA
jgi:hypothetical protein